MCLQWFRLVAEAAAPPRPLLDQQLSQVAQMAMLKRVELGEYIVADPEICHGKPTFKGTRIMAWQVLDDVGDGRAWDFICNHRWDGRIP